MNLTMPLSAWLGWTQSAGDVPGYGPLDAEDSRTLADLLARRPGNQWCVTLTDPAGHPVAHACARHGPPGPPDAAPPRPRGPTSATPGDQLSKTAPGGPSGPDSPGAGTSAGSPTGQASPPNRSGAPNGPATPVPDWLRGLTFTTLHTATCTHPRQSRGYQPSASLRHLVQIRNPTCTRPGCRRPADHCDLDHTIPYDQGGLTCLCNIGPACKS